MIVLNFLNFIAGGGPKRHCFSVDVHPLHLSFDKLRAIKQWSNRVDRMSRFQNTRTRLKEKRRHQKIVIPADEGDPDLASAARELLQVQRRVDAAKPAAQDHHTLLLLLWCRHQWIVVD